MSELVDGIEKSGCKKEHMNCKYRSAEAWIVFAVALMAVIAFSTQSHLLDVGYFWGDHQMYLVIYNKLQVQSFWQTLYEVVMEDLALRWRPLFPIQYVVETSIFGLNWFAMRILRCVEWAFCFSLFYSVARRMEVNKIWSVLFSAVIFIGSQMQILQGLCIASLVCIIPTGFALLNLVQYYKTQNSQYKLFFEIALIFVTLSLEEYFVLVPFL